MVLVVLSLPFIAGVAFTVASLIPENHPEQVQKSTK